MKWHRLAVWSMALPMLFTLGCSMKKSDADAMAKPPRPAELDLLNQWVGNWKSTGTMKMAGSDEAMTMTGSSTAEWAVGQRYMVERMKGQDNKGNTFEGIGLWTWDPKAKKYRVWWFDDFGGASSGTARYDESSKTWSFKGKTHNMPMGMSTTSVGKATWTGEKTMTWSHDEHAMMGMMKVMEMEGTSQKQ